MVDIPGVGDVLGGIEWVGQGDAKPDELPAPEDIAITLATPNGAAHRGRSGNEGQRRLEEV